MDHRFAFVINREVQRHAGPQAHSIADLLGYGDLSFDGSVVNMRPPVFYLD
jgi:hypothetical protein